MRRGPLLFIAAAGAVAGMAAVPEPNMPTVSLNHVYRVLDVDSFKAADASEYLRTEFAPFERRTTKSGDDTWTGLYYYGESTYFEFLQADPERDRPVGQSGIAFGIESEGGSAAVRKALDRLGIGDAKTVERTRESAGKMVPWFSMTGFEPIDSILVYWVMEYSPSFLREWHPELRPGLAGIARKTVLERYQAKAALTVPPKDPLLRNVTGFRLALDSARRESLGKALAAFGYRHESKGAADSWRGPDIRIELVAESGEQRGIVAIDMVLTRKPPEDKVLEFGRARLEIRADGTASFRF